ncbi:hypothetical protein AYY27_13305 [Photobacterium damselae]|uniref:Uncharacterized protein n=2 Tax=Photobacterium damselae TaxID=38293 RepID=A0ABD6X479_PHODM|nr:hypothetical protein AYY27_13305 [Photobacterium damselae]PSU17194.1 hypothetical protein CTM90_09810 [Photobacterium damselae]
MMAADTRVSFQSETGGIASWKDYKAYRKAIEINGILYGFAGTNLYFIELLEELRLGSADVDVLDFLATEAQTADQSFIVMRYDNDLRIFGFLDGALYDSSSTILNVDYYGIGSGAHCSVYKKHKSSNSALIPIRKIIETNEKAIKKAVKKDASLSQEHYGNICHQAGGDNGTGGEINMTTQQKSTNIIEDQLGVLRAIENEAASYGAVAVCSIDEVLEKEKLDKLGVKASNMQQKVPNREQQKLHERMTKRMAERRDLARKIAEARC